MNPDGRYGRWNMTGIVIYLIGILVQIPFLSTAFYTGPLVEPLGGVDISWIVGLLVPGVLYYTIARAAAAYPAHLTPARFSPWPSGVMY
jgi:NCS1 family nucleobase:cation symporter-1